MQEASYKRLLIISFHSYKMSRIGNLQTESRVVAAGGWSKGWGQRGGNSQDRQGEEGFFLRWWCSKSHCGDGGRYLWPTALHTLKASIAWWVNYISIKPLFYLLWLCVYCLNFWMTLGFFLQDSILKARETWKDLEWSRRDGCGTKSASWKQD